MKNKKVVLWISCICALAAVMGLAACAPRVNTEMKGITNQGAVTTPQADEYGVVHADAWASIYPDQYKTFTANESNSPESGKVDYLKLYPALNLMYKGYAFALGYDEAASHSYSLESVMSTPRTNLKAQLANCITCKTPQYTAMVNEKGDSAYQAKFWDTVTQFTENISCYNCHENNPTELSIPAQYWVAALGEDVNNEAKAPKASQTCGQCHNEYYFNPSTKATTNPYTGTDQMTPDAILAYYDKIGFSDWTHPETGAGMIKAQHPEFETNYGGEGSPMAKQGFTCADCHMATEQGTNGAYSSHDLVSPLENETLLSKCGQCHSDITSKVHAIQASEESRVTAISEKIEKLITKISEGRANGSLTGDKLTKLQTIHRQSQFYWDFVMVENSEGAHNSKLTNETLDKAEKLVDEGLAML